MSASRAAVRLVFSFRLTLLWTLLCCTQYCERVYADGLSVTEVRNGRDRHLQAEQSSSTIFGNSLEPGWTVQSAGVTTQQVRGAVNNGSQAFCASFAAAKDEIYFTCQNCSRLFELTNTAGLRLTVRRTRSDFSAFEKDPSRARLPAVTIKLYDASLTEACDFQLYNEAEKSSPINDARLWRFDDMNSLTRNATTGLFTRSFPFQNFQSCTSSRASITVVGFRSDAAGASFCLEDLRLLPTKVPSPEVLANATAPSYPRFPNCRGARALELKPVDEDGYFLVLQDKTAIHNVSGSQPSTSYTVFPGIDLPGYYDIKHVRLPATDSPDTNFSCSTNSYAPNITQVNECADLNPGGVCCIDTAPYQSVFGAAKLPEELANICNGLTISGKVCQGFNINDDTKVAFFKGQPPNIPLNWQHTACNFPGFSFWALNAALSLTGTDVRAIAMAIPVGSSPQVLYGNSLHPDWVVKSLSSQEERIKRKGAESALDQPQPFCTTLPTSGDAVYFSCLNCSQAGYGPLHLKRASGFRFTIWETANYSSDTPIPMQATLPNIQLKLGSDLFEATLCEFPVGATAQTTLPNGTVRSESDVDDAAPTRGGKFTRSFLFRNFEACVGPSAAPALANISSIGFFSKTGNVTFCFEDFSLLLTEVPSPEVLAAAIRPSYPRFKNCRADTPQQTDEDGTFLVLQPEAVAHNVMRSLPSTGYTSFPGVNISQYDLLPVSKTTGGLTCSTDPAAPNITLIDQCADATSCCIDTATHQSALGNASLPEELARICDGLRINDIVCQGFSYNSSSGRAYFKGQPPNTPFDMQKACNYPDFSLWVLNSALNSMGTDMRPIAAPPVLSTSPPVSPFANGVPPAPPSSTESKLGAVWGVVAAVVGPSIAIATWFGLTWTYRTEKRIILNEVIRRLKVSDLGKADPAHRTIARDITRRCLRRWDGWLGIRASSDSLGNRAGIWRDRYDTVRCAVLLLAFRKLNQALQANPSSFRADSPRNLLDAWQNSKSHSQRRDVISWISKKVQEISEDDAQALPDRDPDRAGFYDEVCSKLTCCSGR